MDILSFLWLPFLAALVLTGIHAYLGVHVVERGVIFVDLSLAQIAALGTTVALLAGYDVHSTISYFWSLGFTLIGAAFFAFARVHRETRIPQEAIIGIVYAVSAAAAVLVVDRAPQGGEHIKTLLVGSIQPADMSLTRPHIMVRLDPDGRSNWSNSLATMARTLSADIAQYRSR
jgi:zinc/manganese transport system permease protein